MKEFLKILILTVLGAVSVVACTKVEEEDPTTNAGTPTGTTLTANTSSSTGTRISFENKDYGYEDDGTYYDGGIDLKWEEYSDSFSVYIKDDVTDDESSYSYVGDFTCESVDDYGSGTFTSDKTLEYGDYKAIYPAVTGTSLSYAEALASDLTSEQDGDAIKNLEDACMMTASFTYEEGSNAPITFNHEKAVATFTFTSDVKPKELVFKNGDVTYTVTYTYIEPVDGYYTSYIMVEPCAGTERTLTFELKNSGGVCYDYRSATSTIAYEAGYRYTFPITDENDGLPIDIAYNSDSVYEIYTAKGLEAFADLVDATTLDSEVTYVDNTGGNNFAPSSISNTTINGKLMDDIDLSTVCSETLGSWDPIGSAANRYAGTFDGGGHKVTGLYINTTTLGKQALFAFTTIDGVVCNLGVSGEVTGADYEVAGIVAYNYGTVVNCYNLAAISGNINVGGVVGHNDGCVINCYNQGAISGVTNVGGICGQSDDESDDVNSVGYGYILACYSAGTVTGTSNFGLVLGWLNALDRSIVSECYAVGDDTTDNLIGVMKATTTTNADGTVSSLPEGALASSTYPKFTMTEDEMKGNVSLVASLNLEAIDCNKNDSLKVKACKWKVDSGCYPELDFGETPTYTETTTDSTESTESTTESE